MAAPKETEHPDHLGRRHRLVQYQRLQPRHHGVPHPEHRPHRQRRRDVHRLVRPAKLYRRPCRLHHWPVADPHRADQGRLARIKLGLQPEDPTIAELLKPQGYVCGQFGKNHLGDRDEFLPTVHGFDEFFGNLYHLNAEEEPENRRLSESNPEFKKKFGPRGVLHCWANAGRHAEDRRYRPADQEAHGDHG